MSNTTAVAMATAITLAVFAAPAEAGNGLSKKQVRSLVKQEVARILRVQGQAGPQGPAGPGGPQGPAGPTGPAGMGGMPFFFATIDLFGHLGTGHPSNVITEANVRLVEGPPEFPDDDPHAFPFYCISGLPQLSGGQVTIVHSDNPGPFLAELNISASPEAECDAVVRTFDFTGRSALSSFYILLY